MRLFGSVSRGEHNPDSDIDLLVELEPGRTLLDLAKFRRKAGQILGVPVDVATPDMLKERFRTKVLAQAIDQLLVEQEPDEQKDESEPQADESD